MKNIFLIIFIIIGFVSFSHANESEEQLQRYVDQHKSSNYIEEIVSIKGGFIRRMESETKVSYQKEINHACDYTYIYDKEKCFFYRTLVEENPKELEIREEFVFLRNTFYKLKVKALMDIRQGIIKTTIFADKPSIFFSACNPALLPLFKDKTNVLSKKFEQLPALQRSEM